MGTEINVTVGPQSLLQQSRQQTDANRFNRAEQDAQRRTQAAATTRRRQLGLTLSDLQQYGDPRQRRFRRQKPAAFRFGGEGFLIGPQGSYVDGLLPVLTSKYAPLQFSKFDSVNSYEGEPQFFNFDTTAGPLPGTLALYSSLPGGIGNNATFWGFGLGYVFLSDFASETFVNLRKVSDSIQSNQDYIGIAESAPANIWTGYAPSVALPTLLNPRARAAEFDAFTFEFIHRPGSSSVIIEINNTSISMSGFPSGVYLFLSGVAAPPSGKGTYYPSAETFLVNMLVSGNYSTDIALNPGIMSTWHHVAFCKSGNLISFYVGGQRMFTATAASNYWDRYALSRSPYPAPTGSSYVLNVGDLPIIAKIMAVNYEGSYPPSAIHGIRFTPRALYTTPTITPPTSITTLA